MTPGGKGGELPLCVQNVIQDAGAVSVALCLGVPGEAHGFGLVGFWMPEGAEAHSVFLLECLGLDGAGLVVCPKESRFEVGIVHPDTRCVPTHCGSHHSGHA